MTDFVVKKGLQIGGGTKLKSGTIAGNATLDLSSGNYFAHTPTADTTFVFSNPPAAGKAHGFALKVTGANVDQGYDLANASYDSVSFSVSVQEATPEGIFLRPDGNKMYVCGRSGDEVNEYNLSTSWDISTATFVQNFSVASQDGAPKGLFFKPDGLKMYIAGDGSDRILEYSLSAAWNISTASYVQGFSVATEDTIPQDVLFKPDGTKMYVLGGFFYSVYEYNLSTPWDVSSATFVQSFSVIIQESFVLGFFIKPDGTKMYVTGQNSDAINEYDLSAAWDISTASYTQNFSVGTQDTVPASVFFKTDGTKMYMMGQSSDTVYQYSTASATPAPATFTYPASVKFPNAVPPTAPAVGETDVLTFCTDDGGTTYYGIQRGDDMS